MLSLAVGPVAGINDGTDTAKSLKFMIKVQNPNERTSVTSGFDDTVRYSEDSVSSGNYRFRVASQKSLETRSVEASVGDRNLNLSPGDVTIPMISVGGVASPGWNDIHIAKKTHVFLPD